MNKLFTIYMCALVIVISIAFPLAFPAVMIVTYIEQGFSGVFIFISIITILIEPLIVWVSYVLLSSIKEIYNDLLM